MNKSWYSATILALIIFSGLFFFSNASASTYVSGDVNGSATWVNQNNPYMLSGNVLISIGETLTIQAGTIVHLNGYQIQVYGTLNAAGSSGSKIAFLSDGNSNSQIYFGGASSSNCVIDNANFYSVPVVVGGGTPRISNCYFTACSSTTVTVNGGSPQIVNNVINGGSPQNCIAINQASASATITSNVLAGGFYGIYSLGGTINVVGNSITSCYSGIYSSGQSTIEQNVIVQNTHDAIVTKNFNQEIHNNALAYNTCGISGDGNIQNNTITNNQYGLYGQTTVSNIQYNNVNNNDENVHLTETNINVNAQNNWWGTTDEASIRSRISDWHIHSNLGNLTYIPYLTEPATAPSVPSSVSVPSAPPTPTVAPSSTPTATPTATPNVYSTATPTPYPNYTPTPTPYPHETYWPTPTAIYFDTPTPTAIEFGGYSIGDITSVVAIVFAVALAITIIVIINRKFTRNQSLPLPPPPPAN